MRPIGSLLMGRYADRHGRRAALTLSITVMAGGSLIIACTPSYESIGIMAPIIFSSCSFTARIITWRRVRNFRNVFI